MVKQMCQSTVPYSPLQVQYILSYYARFLERKAIAHKTLDHPLVIWRRSSGSCTSIPNLRSIQNHPRCRNDTLCRDPPRQQEDTTRSPSPPPWTKKEQRRGFLPSSLKDPPLPVEGGQSQRSRGEDGIGSRANGTLLHSN